MEKTVYKNKLITALKRIRVNDLVLIILALCLLLALILAVKNMGRERTIIVPPVVHDEFWVDSNDADPKYLQEMATYFIFLANNVSPENIEYQNNLIINYVNPSEQGMLRTQLAQQAARIKRNQLTTMFSIIGYKVDAGANIVIVNGVLKSIIGDKVVSTTEKSYRVSFQIINGQLYINEFGEVNNNDPFGEIINEKQ